MATIAYRILKFDSLIKNTIAPNQAFLIFITFIRITSFTYINFIVIQPNLIIPNLLKDCHQDNLSFVSLQFYDKNYLNILAGNICSHIQVKNQYT